MISIMLTKTTNNKYVLKMEGHADYNPGNDVVCASASMLVYTLAARLVNLGEDVQEKDVEDGYALILFNINDDTTHALKTVLCGFQLLQDKFPDHVKMKCYKNGADLP